MSYNKPTIPKGTRYFWGVFVFYFPNYQRFTYYYSHPIGVLNFVKFAENRRFYGRFW